MKSVFLLIFLCLSFTCFSQTITWDGKYHVLTTPFGGGWFGAENPGSFFFDTDRAAFYFTKRIRINGPIGANNSNLWLQTDDITRLTIESGTGNVGIGTSTPFYRLDVAGTVNASNIITPSFTFYNNNSITSSVTSNMDFNLEGDADWDLRLDGDLYLNFRTTREKFYFDSDVVLGSPTLATHLNRTLTLELDQGQTYDPNISFEYSLVDGDIHLTSNQSNIAFDNPVKFAQGFETIGSIITPNVTFDNNNQITSPSIASMEFNLDGDTDMDLRLDGDLYLNFRTSRQKFYFDSDVVLGSPTLATHLNGKLTLELDQGQSNDPNISFEYSTGDDNLHINSNKSNIDFDNPVIFNHNIGIGTSAPTQKLSVAGNINAEEIILEDVVGADFVFEEDYDLRSLAETEQFIKTNKHLPEIPSAAEMAEEGLEIKEMNILLLQKVEELTLHLIRMEKEIQQLKAAQNND